MNGTEKQGSILGSFSYLNQTAHSLVPENILFSSIVNYPYRVGLSLLKATQLQYQQAVESDALIPSIQSVMDTIGYFFSSYAIASFVTALILNRFVIMASLRSNTNRVTLPLWSRFLLHLSAIVPLTYNVVQSLCQVQLISIFPPVDFSFFLARTFTILAWSHCVETFVTTTTNSKPLEESDYTIFELSVQFYYLCQRNPSMVTAQEYLSDCLMALFGRILIHMVEMFNLRRFRLLGSTILNSLNITYLLYKIGQSGFESIPMSTRCRHFPKIFSLFLIAISVLSYTLACLVRKNPFGNQKYDTKELQFYSFMHNWWNHLNCTGEEEFSHVVNKMALLLCNGTESMNKGIHREFSALNVPTGIHHSYIVSGYLNRVSTIPEDLASPESLEKKTSQRIPAPAFFFKLRVTYDLFKAFFSFLFKHSWKKDIPIEHSSTGNDRLKKSKDYNKFVTEKNYSRFLTKPELSDNGNNAQSLLPEEDFSEDYQPDIKEYEEIDESDVDIDESSVDRTREEIREELVNILAPNDVENLQTDIGWFMSMWSILKCQVKQDTRLTRSQYAALSPEIILTEVVLDRSATLHEALLDDHIVGEDEDGDSAHFACVVCRISPRNVVLWPCKCFALCEDCRISLGLRGFNSCVCCRSEVHGYSKLNSV